MTGTSSQSMLIGIGAAAYLDCDLALELDDLSPASHGALQLRATVVDGVVTAAEPLIGLMHRSAEKLFEARDFRQIMMLANRHDWLSAFSGELGVALAVESSLGLTPPPLATWTRTLLAEVNRLAATMLLAASGLPRSEALELLHAREPLVDLQEAATGGRVHPMMNRVGGLAHPVDDSWLEALEACLAAVRTYLPRLEHQLEESLSPLAGIACLDDGLAMAFGASGAVGRASGVSLDARLMNPYCAYSELRDLIRLPTANGGDIPARYRLLVAHTRVAMDLIEACLDPVRSLRGQPYDSPLPKTVRVPEGTVYQQVETPLGIAGTLLVGAGDKTPWRLKLRTPSFAHLQAMGPALTGTPLSHLASAISSFFFVTGDADR